MCGDKEMLVKPREPQEHSAAEGMAWLPGFPLHAAVSLLAARSHIPSRGGDFTALLLVVLGTWEGQRFGHQGQNQTRWCTEGLQNGRGAVCLAAGPESN